MKINRFIFGYGLLLFFIPVLFFSCKNESKNEESKLTSVSDNFEWLQGHWKRINEEEGKETNEIWKKKNDLEFYGLGFTMKNNDTIWMENIKLVRKDAGWNFEVTGKGDTIPTIFNLTKIGKESFISENDQNEFPKKIHYYKNGEKLTAIISGGGMEIPFEFERKRTEK